LTKMLNLSLFWTGNWALWWVLTSSLLNNRDGFLSVISWPHAIADGCDMVSDTAKKLIRT
jgi:hypothetical protein